VPGSTVIFDRDKRLKTKETKNNVFEVPLAGPLVLDSAVIVIRCQPQQPMWRPGARIGDSTSLSPGVAGFTHGQSRLG